jgi:flagellar M-ring protein FliF
VVDQNGNLLSDTTKKLGAKNLDPEQLKYVDEIQQSIVKRVESIISPIVGLKNVRAEASAEIDFSVQEQAAETYKPNQQPDAAAVRSMQSNETQSVNGDTAGIPGALSNQPPPAATAPITTEGATDANGQPVANAAPINSEKNLTTNYEVDKTVSYRQQPMGGIKRLNVAVVVNNMPVIDKKTGKVTYRALTAAEKTQINDLAMQAMGFNRERGDSLTIVNTPFAGEPEEVLPAIPLWENPRVIENVKDVLRFLVGVIALFIIYRKVLKPLLNKLTAPKVVATNQSEAPDTVVNISEDGTVSLSKPAYEQKIETAKQIAKDNPRMVASVVANWTNGNE